MAEPRTVSELLVAQAPARAQLPFGAATVVGLGVHVTLLIAFGALGTWPMAAFNLVSVGVFGTVWWAFSRGRFNLGLALAIAEIVVHQILAVYFCGWEPGFQYYLLTVVPLCLMLPGVRTRAGLALASIPAATFLLLAIAHANRTTEPEYALPPPIGQYAGIFNALFSFAALWVFVAFYRRGAETAEERLADAFDRTERLLHGILPPSIIERLREKPGVVADAVDSATILFADLVGFTPLAQKKSAAELVTLLDGIFASLDDLVTERGLEKIKTIGDAYMVGSGVPDARADHAHAMADLAFAIQRCVAAHAERLGEPLSMRIGIATGPVVAGVIGKSKFAYDLWGDTVNTAARMESHGEPGRIHVTQATAKALGDAFELEARGVVEIKGKGAMQTYWLVGRAKPRERSDAAAQPAA